MRVPKGDRRASFLAGDPRKEHQVDIRKATEQDIDAILALNRQIGQLHFEQVPGCSAPVPGGTGPSCSAP